MLDRVIVNKSLTEATVITDDKTYKLFSSSGDLLLMIEEFMRPAYVQECSEEITQVIEIELLESLTESDAA